MKKSFLKRKLNICFSLLCAIVLLCAACDPAQTIDIINKTPSKAVAKFYFKGEPTFLLEGFWVPDSLVVELDSLSSKTFDFGIGHWKVLNGIDSLTDRVESVKLQTQKSTKTFESGQEVKDFFQSRLKGSFSERIEIILE